MTIHLRPKNIKNHNKVSVFIEIQSLSTSVAQHWLTHVSSFLGEDERYSDITVIYPSITKQSTFKTFDLDNLKSKNNIQYHVGSHIPLYWIEKNRPVRDRFKNRSRIIHQNAHVRSWENSGFDYLDCASQDLVLILKSGTLLKTRDRVHDWLGDLLFGIQSKPSISVAILPQLQTNWSYLGWEESNISNIDAGCFLVDRKRIFTPETTTAVGGDGRTGLITLNNRDMQSAGTLKQILSGLNDDVMPFEQLNIPIAIKKTETQKPLWSCIGSHEMHSEAFLQDLLNIWNKEPGCLVLRHSFKDPDKTITDERLRGLSQEGLASTRRLETKLCQKPNAIFTSTLKRCLETAKLLDDNSLVYTLDTLLGPEIKQQHNWKKQKSHLGWSLLFHKWIHGKISSETIEGYDDWTSGEGFKNLWGNLEVNPKSILISQGIVVQALCKYAFGHIEFSGDGLCGFFLPQKTIEQFASKQRSEM